MPSVPVPSGPVPSGPVPSGGPTDPATSAWPARVPWRAVVTFVVVACGLAWLVAAPLWAGDGLASPLFAVLAAVTMWTPAAAVLVVTLLLRVPARDRLRALGAWPLRPARRTVGLTAVGLVVPLVVVAVTTLVAGAVGLVDLDLVGFSGFAAQVDATLPAGASVPPVTVLVVAQLLAIPLAALVNSLLALGEEIGWRGWLLPALLPLGTWPALLVSGAVWGLWHAPLILLGYNFGRTDAVGVLLMVGGCVAWGVLLGWLRLRSGSLWPAVVAHGSLNAVGGLAALLVAVGETPDMAVVGPLGLVGWGVLAVVAVVLAATGQLRRRGALGTPAATAAPTA
ncbi:CPBP family intramembrane glutamic endopeptidase [Cellulomonas sp. NPDC057328]|uniref:CPBP family intramembrane glutamic endopeptidase n=1 Tax=Cellulomonas sp. NPDC057328 TaxID=3346101 RepID=UPI00362A267C